MTGLVLFVLAILSLFILVISRITTLKYSHGKPKGTLSHANYFNPIALLFAKILAFLSAIGLNEK